MRPIDADALIKPIEETHCKGCNNYNGVMCRACKWMDAMDYIEDAPTIEAEPVKRGKWEHERCTECGKSLEDLFSGEFYYDQEEVKFCPNCGAKMGGYAYMNDKPHWTNTDGTVWDARDKDGKQELEISIVAAKCSVCGKWAEQVNAFPPYMHYRYCPHCGKKMDGGVYNG